MCKVDCCQRADWDSLCVRGVCLLQCCWGGVDIGCGMCAVPVDGLHKDDLSLHDTLQLQSLIKVHGKVASHIACDIIVDSGSFIQASCYTVNSEWLLQQADCK
jgi:hypothetical protein